MAQGKNNVAENAAESAKQAGTVKNENVFPIATLRNNCMKLFGCTSSTFDGAFFKQKDKEYTVNEAKKIIESWLKEEVK